MMTAAAMMTATAMMTAAAAMTAAATDKCYDTGSGIAFQDRQRGCLCRPQYKTCGEQSARKGSHHS
jgi:hypothetical protein